MSAFTTAVEPQPHPVAPVARPIDKPGRLVSLDVFRGLTVAAMVLVTDPGTYGARYAPLCHSDWVGPTFTDMIFPAFLVAIGMAMAFSFAARIERGATRTSLLLHSLKRCAVLVVLGLLVNGFPDYHLATLRLPGILQHIALCYLAGAILYLAIFRMPRNRRMLAITAVAAAALALYWALLKLVPVPGFGPGRLDSFGNLGAYIDRTIFTVPHLWIWGTTPGHGVTFDPDGLLLSISSLANLLFGLLAAEWIRAGEPRTRKAVGLIALGALLTVAGLTLSHWMPLNKKLWTSTFTLLSSGVTILFFTLLYFVLDIRRWRAWSPPALVFGTNTILAFAISSVITTSFDRIHVTAAGHPLTLHQWGYQYAFATWLRPINASLAYAIAIVLLNLAILYPLYRKRIFLRV